MGKPRAGMSRWNLKQVQGKGFVGEAFMARLLKEAGGAEERALAAALWLTGGRITEVLQLRKEDLRPMGGDVIVVSLPLAKKFRKGGRVRKWKCVGHCFRRWSSPPSEDDYRTHRIVEYEGWACEKMDVRREAVFWIREVGAPELLEYVRSLPPGARLFPDYDRKTAHRAMVALGRRAAESLLADPQADPWVRHALPVHTCPHWFRAQRASYLGSAMTPRELMEYFRWSSPDMAYSYSRASLRELAEKIKSLAGGGSGAG